MNFCYHYTKLYSKTIMSPVSEHKLFLNNSKVQPARKYDYLYDPTCVLSCARDHARDTLRAHAAPERFKCVPRFNTMFSTVGRYRRFDVRLDTTDDVPRWVSREWRSPHWRTKDAIERARNAIREEAFAVRDKGHGLAAECLLYHRVPLKNFYVHRGSAVFSPVRRGRKKLGVDKVEERRPARRRTGKYRSVHTQTVVRDDETQTTPCALETTSNIGVTSELLGIAFSAHERGVSVSADDVALIEHVRQLRSVEAALSSAISSTARANIVEQLERCRWFHREQEIEELKKIQLSTRLELIERRDIEFRTNTIEKLDAKMALKQDKNIVKKRAQIQRSLGRAIRVMLLKKQEQISRLGALSRRRDIIAEYGDYGSQAFAPLTKLGLYPDRCQRKFSVQSRFLNSYRGLLELERTMPEDEFRLTVPPPLDDCYTSNGYLKKKCRYDKDLADLYKALSHRRQHPDEKLQPSSLLERSLRHSARPATPTVDQKCRETCDTDLAVIALQSTIRGCAANVEMSEGLSLSAGVMTELRTTDPLWKESRLIAQRRRERHRLEEQQRHEFLRYESTIDELLSELDSETLADMLRFLSLELERIVDEQRIQAMKLLVERIRRTREAEESGTRQEEERRRRADDEIFRQMMKVQQDSVDNYLEDIVMGAGGAVETAAEQEARQEIKEHAAAIDRLADELDKRNDSYEEEMLAAELVYSFLIPEVYKEEFRRKVRERQHRYLQAAHRHVYQIVDEDILPFPELYQQRDDHVEPHGGAQRRPRPTPSAQTAGEEQQEEEEDEEDEEDMEEEETEEEEDEEQEEEGVAAEEHEDAEHHSVPNVSNHDTSS